MNFKHLILLSLFVYATFAAQCAAITGSCNRCQAAGCDWCDATGFGFFSCVDSGTCAKTAQANGTCAVACGDYTKCTDCQANTTCSYCSYSGFGSCSSGSTCTAPYTKIDTCPKVCEAASAPQAGSLCGNLPYQVPANESFSIYWKSCRTGGLGYPSDQNVTANCTDKCTLERAKLPETCLSKQRLLLCGASCPACDADMTSASYTDYYPCQSFCDDVNTTCNTGLSEECKLNYGIFCSKNTDKCNKMTGVTTNPQSNACTPASSTSAAVSSAQSSAGQSSAGQSSNGATSAGQSSQGNSNATSAAASTKASSSTSASSTTGSAGSIFVCVILGFFALLI